MNLEKLHLVAQHLNRPLIKVIVCTCEGNLLHVFYKLCRDHLFKVYRNSRRYFSIVCLHEQGNSIHWIREKKKSDCPWFIKKKKKTGEWTCDLADPGRPQRDRT